MSKNKARILSMKKLNCLTDRSARIQDVCLFYIYLIFSVVLFHTGLITKYGLTSKHNLLYNQNVGTLPKDFRHALNLRLKTENVLDIKHKIFDTRDKRDAEYKT